MNSAVKKKFVTTIIVERGMTYVEQINLTRVPKHIAIIMDGNGRWAKERGLDKPMILVFNKIDVCVV